MIEILLKAENPHAYKKLAEAGMAIMHPVSIAGETHRKDVDLPYHATVKFFDAQKDNPHEVHEIASGLTMIPPNPERVMIKPGMFKDRLGNDVYVIKLHGPHTDQMKQNNKAFSHLGPKVNYEYEPHISVDKNMWNKISSSGAKTAAEAGISFGHAELKQGNNLLATYKNQLNKSFVRGAMAALSIAGAAANAIPSAESKQPHAPSRAMASVPANKASSPLKYDSKKMLQTIAQVESSGGKNISHKPLTGMHEGETAYGKYGLTPHVIRETIHMNKDLRAKHGNGSRLKGEDLHNYMDDNPGLEDVIAQRHLKRLEHHFGGNPSKIAFGWLNGIRGTYKAKNEGVDFKNHWHVKKINKVFRGI